MVVAPEAIVKKTYFEYRLKYIVDNMTMVVATIIFSYQCHTILLLNFPISMSTTYHILTSLLLEFL
jgi:hypothetical protein